MAEAIKQLEIALLCIQNLKKLEIALLTCSVFVMYGRTYRRRRDIRRAAERAPKAGATISG